MGKLRSRRNKKISLSGARNFPAFSRSSDFSSVGFTPSLENGVVPQRISVPQWFFQKTAVKTRQLLDMTGRHRNATPFFSAGFTLIELLTVVAIAGMLLSGVLVLFQGTRAKSRDATREQHVKTLQNALALYANNLGVYPAAASGVVLSGSDAVSLALTGQNVITQVPRDPLNQGNYQYRYQSVDGTTYVIRYWLETDSVSGKPAGENTASP